MRKLTIILLFPFLFGCLQSLEDEGISNETVYKGRVINESYQPLSGITVKITNGSLTYKSTITNKDGIFQITVDITKIDSEFYIQVGDESYSVKRSSLKGFAGNEYDYGDIPFEDYRLPVVETIAITEITNNSFTCKCNVKSQGGGSITERGICWGINEPTIYDNKQPFGSGTGTYVCTINNVNVETTIYYARAYAINEYGVFYGSIIEINNNRYQYFNLTTFEFGGYIYHIHSDIGEMTWGQAISACKDLNSYGFKDWSLPSPQELFAIIEKTSIMDNNYDTHWTSEEYGSGRAIVLFYSYGWRREDRYKENNYRVLPIRKDHGDGYIGDTDDNTLSENYDSSKKEWDF